MNLLILISGKKEKLIEKHQLSFDRTVKIDEKSLSKPLLIRKIIKSNNFNRIYFGTIDIELQRFQFFINLYILLFASGRGSIIDYKGNVLNFNLYQMVFVFIPLIIIELIISAFLVIVYYIKLPYLKWKMK